METNTRTKPLSYAERFAGEPSFGGPGRLVVSDIEPHPETEPAPETKEPDTTEEAPAEPAPKKETTLETTPKEQAAPEATLDEQATPQPQTKAAGDETKAGD